MKKLEITELIIYLAIALICVISVWWAWSLWQAPLPEARPMNLAPHYEIPATPDWDLNAKG